MATKIALPELLNSRAAVQLKTDLDAEIDKDVQLDLAAVRHVGAQALQVLISAQILWNQSGRSFALSGATADALERIAALGGAEHLEIGG